MIVSPVCCKALERPSGSAGAGVGRPLRVDAPSAQLVQPQGLRLPVSRREHLGVVQGRRSQDPGQTDPGLVRREELLRLRDAAVSQGAVRPLHHGQSYQLF